MRGQAPHEPGAHRRPMDGALLFACMLLAAEDFERRGDYALAERVRQRAATLHTKNRGGSDGEAG